MSYIIERLKEGSTWSALIALAAAFGLKMAPEQSAAIGAILMIFLPNNISSLTTSDK